MVKELKFSMRLKQEDLDKLDALCRRFNIDSKAAVILKLVRDEYEKDKE
jgi:hypothetical protein